MKTPSKTVNASGEEQVEDISPTTLEAATILTKVQKIKKEREFRRSKTKEQILQEEAGLAEAIRLDALEKALEKKEVAKQVHLDSLLAQRMAEEQELTEEQEKRKAQVQFKSQSYTEEDWDTIRASQKFNIDPTFVIDPMNQS
ncbi:hypothetical protein Tco_0187245 [Tanacetum coccineum]